MNHTIYTIICGIGYALIGISMCLLCSINFEVGTDSFVMIFVYSILLIMLVLGALIIKKFR